MGEFRKSKGGRTASQSCQTPNCPSSSICESITVALRFHTHVVTQNADNDLWETNRMQTSGVLQRGGVDDDFDDDSDSKVHVLVHDLKPPFLDGTVAYTKQLDPINPVKDGTSDMAIFAKKGSVLVRERRERQEREKVRPYLYGSNKTLIEKHLGGGKGGVNRRYHPR